MIKIAKKELTKGLVLSRSFYNCRSVHDCLWRKRADLFKGFLPRGCLKENCPVVIFRKKFEDDSPCHYAEALRLSQWWCVSSLAKINRKREREKRELERRVDNLNIYERLVVLAIHPLDLSVGEIPFLKSEEIKTLKRDWSPKERNRTEEVVYEINPDWYFSVGSAMKEFVGEQTYNDAVFYLIYLFLKGFEKNQQPDMEAMSQEERAKLFSEIEKYLHV